MGVVVDGIVGASNLLSSFSFHLDPSFLLCLACYQGLTWHDLLTCLKVKKILNGRRPRLDLSLWMSEDWPGPS